MAEYYYLMASLPELKLEEPPAQDQLEEAFQLIQRQIEPADAEAFRWLLYRNDVYNLIEYWQDEQNIMPPRPMRYPSSLDREELARTEREPSLLPPFLHAFMEEEGAKAPHWPATEIENRLHAQFFSALPQAPHPFLQDYYAFEDELRAIIATYHQSLYHFIDQEPQYLNKNLRQRLRKGQAGLSENLKRNMPFLPELLNVLASKEVDDISTQVHRILWNRAEELSQGHYFDLYALLAYGVRLFLLFRRKHLDKNRQEAHLQALIEFAISTKVQQQ